MLEDRLSTTYSQHRLGGDRSQVAPQSSMYPSLHTESMGTQGGAESYYNTTGPSPNAYPHYNQYTNHPSTQHAYTQRDRAPSNTSSGYEQSQPNGQVPHRASSLHQYPQSQQSQIYQQPSLPNSVDPFRTPVAKNTQDSAAAYYTNHPHQFSTPQTYQQQQQYNQSYASPPSPEQPAQPLPQQQHFDPTSHVHQAGPPASRPQQHWQQQQAVSPLQQPHQVPYPPINESYTQDAFPIAPTHPPQSKQVEEQLIEL